MITLADPDLRAQVYALFDVVWPGMARAIEIASRVTTPWHELSTPFVALDGGRVVAHVGLLECPMVIDGERTVVDGIHAVCTHPEFRGRGLASRLLGEALAHARHATALLTAERHALYERHGFRVVRESRFTLPAPRARAAPMRRLTLDDAPLVERLYRGRAPVSRVLATADPGWLPITDELLSQKDFVRFHYAEDLDALAAFELHDRTLYLLDATAPVEAILARVPADFDRAVTAFPVDGAEVSPAPAGDWLMARGPLAVEGRAIGLPALARW
jgi:predicted N-acetyltransferase YhbS